MSEPVSAIANDLQAPFWAAAEQGRLALPLCLDTGRCFWPPSPLSPFTGGPTGWRDSAGGGRLQTVVTYRRVFQEAFRPRIPYAIGLVELDDGPRLQAFVASPDAADALAAGDRVAIVMRQVVQDGPKVPTVERLREPR